MTARLALASLFVLSGCAGVDPLEDLRTDYTRRPVADLPAQVGLDVDAIVAENEGLPAYYLRDERTVEHVFLLPLQPVWTYIEDIRRQYIVVDPEADQYTTFGVTLAEREELEEVVLVATAPDGTSNSYGLADLIPEDGENGRRTLRFAYPNVVAGTLIEEAYRTEREWSRDYQPPLYVETRLQREVPVREMDFRFIFPSSWGLNIKDIARRRRPNMAVDRTSYEGRTMLSYSARDVPAFPDEPFAPFFKEVAPYLEMYVSRIVGAVRGDDDLYTAAESWGELGERFGEYAFDRGGRRFREVTAEAERLAATAETDSARATAILTWVQTEIEHDQRAETDDIAGVLRQRKGNDLFLSSLTNAMMQEAGLESTLLLIHPVSDGYFDEAFVTPGQFYVPAVRVVADGETYVGFPYFEGLPLTALPPNYQGATAMKITSEGFGGFTTLPTRDAEAYASEEAFTIDIDDEGVVRVEEVQTLRGVAAWITRRRLGDLDEDELEEEMEELVTYDEGETQGFEFAIDGLDAPGTPLVIRLSYAIPDLVTITPEEVIVRTGGLLSPASLRSFRSERGSRELPVRIYYDELTTKAITIRHPAGWTLATELADAEDSNRYGAVRGRYTVADGEVRAEQEIRLRETFAPRTAWGAIERLLGAESKLDVPTLVFSTGS